MPWPVPRRQRMSAITKTKANIICWSAVLFGPALGVMGQPLSTLFNFEGGNGANPQAALTASGNTLYGTTYSGGSSNFGTVFAFNPQGGGLSNLYSFNGAIYNAITQTYAPADGANPVGALVLSSNTLYGTTAFGGSNNYGTVFSIETNGANYTVQYNFTGGGNGGDPEAGLLLIGNVLYGTTFIGGTSGEGSVFRVNTDGTQFTNLHSFTGGADGSNPEGSLVVSGHTLFGTTYGPYAGGSGHGTVFQVNTDGSGFSNVYTFTGGADGAFPMAGLVLAGGTLYGTASGGGDFSGSSGDGTVFSVNTNGTGFQSYKFNFSIGSEPEAALCLSGNTLYGTTVNGGSQGYGAVFQIETNGADFVNLYSFTDAADGAGPETGLTLVGNALYGTSEADDAYGFGTIFAWPLALAPSLNITLSGGQITITWSDASFSLQAAPALNGTYTTVSGATSPYTTPATRAARFFRLQGN